MWGGFRVALGFACWFGMVKAWPGLVVFRVGVGHFLGWFTLGLCYSWFRTGVRLVWGSA